MNELLRDLRFGLRGLARHPGFTAVALLVLALGIGANTAIFSVVHAVLLRPLPHRDPGRLVQIWGSWPARNIPFHNITYSDLVDWRGMNRSFETLAAVQPWNPSLTTGGDPERVTAWRANASFFPMLGVRLLHGRSFLNEEDRPGAAAVAVLCHGLWQRRFGSDPAVIGRAITLDGAAYTVVGVLPREFEFLGRTADLFTALALPEAREQRSTATSVSVFARLKPGVTIAQAQADMDGVGRRLGERHQQSLGKNPRVWGLRDWVVREVRPSLLVLLGAVALVLLIACANVANLLLVRAGGRSREIAVRAAMGAGRVRLIRQLLTESALLSLMGGAGGVLLAWWGVKGLVRLVPERYPLVTQARVDDSVLLFTLAVSLLTGLVFGIAPAVVFSRGALHQALKEGSRGSGESLSRNRVRSALVVAEVALALVLLIGAGLLIRSFMRLQQLGPGFNPEGVLVANIALPPAKYGKMPERIGFYRQLVERLEAAPGVVAAGVTSSLPLTAHNTGWDMVVEGRPFPRPGEAHMTWVRFASAGYFRGMEIPLRRGRLFTAQDGAGAPPVAIVNETLARRFWPNEDAVGKRFTGGVPRPGQQINWITVVGVAGDLRHKAMDQEPDAEVFMPSSQFTPPSLVVMVRTRTEASRFAPVLRGIVAGLDKEQPVSQMRPMEEVVANAMAPRRLSMLLVGIFASLALLMAAVGIYGVISSAVTRRTQEFGVRMALGADRRDVLRLVVREGLLLAGAGLVLGLAGAVAATRLIRTLLYGITPLDPAVYGAVGVLLVAVAVAACYLPARRATRIDPATALRYE